ncbi:MAG: hypothetical protein COX40_00775 [Candidatus Omnitrophica bacterium CG23_combo_of_CG06-09_8_20_14_all_40_11]|nr:MAG: hypothetical protein COX40_00775 [Candidatus Omnitrophica bacterium CG23_combo_of_CG06-09_8_20_14_all_40_11]
MTYIFNNSKIRSKINIVVFIKGVRMVCALPYRIGKCPTFCGGFPPKSLPFNRSSLLEKRLSF